MSGSESYPEIPASIEEDTITSSREIPLSTVYDKADIDHVQVLTEIADEFRQSIQPKNL